MDNNWGRPYLAPQAPIGTSASSQFLPQLQTTESDLRSSQIVVRKATAKDLDKLQIELASLYHEETLPQIHLFVRENYNLDASEHQIKNRFKKWDWSKNINWAVVLLKIDERGKIGKKSEVQIRRQPISQEKSKRYIKDHPEAVGGSRPGVGKMVVINKEEVAATPSDIDVFTPTSAGLHSPSVARSPQRQLQCSIESSDVESQIRISEPDPMDVNDDDDLYFASPVRRHTPGHIEEEDMDIAMRVLGQSPALMYEIIYVPEPSFDPPAMSQRFYDGFPVNLMGSSENSARWQLERSPIGFRYRQAEENALWREFDQKTSKFGKNGPEIEQTLSAIIDVLREQRKFQNSREINTAGSAYILLGFHPDALKIFQQIIHAQKHLLGPGHPDMLVTEHEMAWAFYQIGNYKQAERLGKEVIDIGTRIYGADHPATLASINLLALAWKKKGLWGKAEKLGLELVASYRKSRGDEHPSTL
ncbi:uncharacterized protein RSE6_05596 [Rhynchosporium secalis]|uniref:Clr5 domain-containing protein n=1 Tax=Rhynchosporium secalis TaxID=38038 RepID=A0A1E1M891_RHYSE|nr:uncharacterized protein RSE6_05596 [Rhynchosporium secalis]